MARVFVSVGSNTDPESNVLTATEMLARETRIVAVSTFYRTDPIGRPEQPPFYDGVVEIRTDLLPIELKYSILRRIENALGRQRTEDPYAARTIDLDILIYDDLVVETEDLTIPDPDIHTRPFLAIALCELAPDLRLPGSGEVIKEIAARFERNAMEPLTEYTRLLRRSIENESREH